MVRFRARLHIAISLVGQKQTYAVHQHMSALPPKADMSCNGTPAPGLEKIRNTYWPSAWAKCVGRKGSVWYFASGSGFVFCGPARNGGDKAITVVLHIHDIFLADVPKRNT